MRFKAEIILRSIYLSFEKLLIFADIYAFAIFTRPIVNEKKGGGLMPVLLIILGGVVLFGIGFNTVMSKVIEGIKWLFKHD